MGGTTMTVILGTVFTISAVVVGAVTTLYVLAILLGLCRIPVAGIILWAGWPLLKKVHLLAWAGGISGLLLNAFRPRTDGTVIAIIMLAWATLFGLGRIYLRRMM